MIKLLLFDKPRTIFYEQFLDNVDNKILHLQDREGIFLLDKLTERNLFYLKNQVLDKPWNNHLFLGALVIADKNSDSETIRNYLKVINPRLTELFDSFHLTEMSQFDVEIHMYQYFKGSIYPEHSDHMRKMLLTMYKSISDSTKRWVTTNLEEDQQAYFEKYLLSIPSYNYRDFSFHRKARETSENKRKSETDAIVPLLPQIRAEGHFRWNQLNRLYQAFLKARDEVKINNIQLPLDFNYEEPDRVGERYYFRIWDKSSFTLYHQSKSNATSISNAKKRIGAYSEEKNHYFVEFIKAERFDEDEAEGLWFIELFKIGLIGQWYQNANDDEIKQKRELLHSWGYGEESLQKNTAPFSPQHQGVITPSFFVSRHKDKAEGILLDVEQLYVGVTFGLLSLDIFTTTGARINELLQIRNTKECIRKVKVENTIRFCFYATPKGRDEAEPFYISEQTMKLIHLVVKMLKKHYGIENIPSVNFTGDRKHLFPNPKPYFFQYNHRALHQNGILSCLRFLLHGLHFETQDGKPVTIKSHLLRHAFATEAVQRQKIPIDIVAKILHQRDLGVTEYYSEPTQSQVAQSVSDLHDVISDYVDLDEAVLRNPKELEKELEEYKEKVGVFNNVIGGTCVTDYVCPIKMQCLGCQAKIPQPEKKHELLEVIELSKDMEKRFNSMGLTLEVKKAKAMRKHARTELKEIDLIEKYREEQKYEPHIQYDK